MSFGRTLIIFGSPKRGSFTADLVQEFLKQNNISNTVWFDVFLQNPTPCDDCGFCKNNMYCNKPDLKEFYKQFETCDSIVFAFPVYNSSVPAPLKALLDRMQPYYHERFTKGNPLPIQKPRRTVVLMTAGAASNVTELILAQLKPVFKATNCRLELCWLKTQTDSTKNGPLLEQKF